MIKMLKMTQYKFKWLAYFSKISPKKSKNGENVHFSVSKLIMLEDKPFLKKEFFIKIVFLSFT